MLSDNIKNYAHLHLIVFIWGFTAVLGALISLDALPLVWFRMLFGTVFLGGYVLFKKTDLRITTKSLVKFLFAGLIIALHWFTFFQAIKVSNVSITLACLSTGAFFASFLEPILYGKKIVFYEVLFGIIAFFGLYIIFNINVNYLEGILLGLTSAMLSALFTVVNSRFVKDHIPTVISIYELGGGVLFFTIFLGFTHSFSISFFNLSMNDLFYLLILSSICTAYAFVASTKVMKVLSPFTVMLTTNLEPIYGIILAVIVFQEKEKMTIEFYFGAALILLTVILNGIIKLRKSKNIIS